jgi:hypothetical protein
LWKSKRKSFFQRANECRATLIPNANKPDELVDGFPLQPTFDFAQFPVKIVFRKIWNIALVDAMNPETPSPRKSSLKNPFLYSSLVILGVILYVSYVLYSRYESSREYERQTRERQTEQRREEDRLAVEQLGGSELAIRGLYVSPAAIHPGESAQLCYDVANAKTVTLDPPAGEVWPSHSRCLNISPRKTTTYTLSIADAAGKKVSQAVELHVR